MRTAVLALAALFLCWGSSRPSVAEQPYVIACVPDAVNYEAGRAVMEAAYKTLGLEVTFQGFDGAEAIRKSDNGSVSATLQRIDGIQHRYTNLVQVPIPINYLQGLAYSAKYDFPVLGWHSLSPYRIGIVKGVLFAERGTQGMDVAVASTYAELVQWIDEGKVDVGVMPKISARTALQDRQGTKVKEMKGVLETLLLYHYVHKKNAALAQKLSPILKEMLLDGTTKRLRTDAHERLLRSGG